MNTRAVALICLVFLGLSACDAPKPIGPKGNAPKTPSKPATTAKATPPTNALKSAEVHLAALNAQTLLWRGMTTSFTKSLVMARTQLKNQNEELGPKKPSLENASTISILFSGNNHGEREDCGCKHNPLGGLDRRASLIAYAKSPTSPNAIKYWGKGMPANKALFVVDSGESLFKDVSYRLDRKGVRKKVMSMAEAVVLGMNVGAPDVLAVGARELALGTEGLRALQAKAKFPFISANLADSTGKLLFPPSQIVTRGGKKVAFIALTKTRTKFAKFYSSKNLKVLDSVASYRAAVSALPKDLDAVVLLGNDGMANNQKLVEKLRASNLRVDLVITSGSNRLTRRPIWVAGVPLVEPMSRGKYFGRIDLYQRAPADKWQFANDTPDVFSLLTDYSRAFKSYAQAQVGLLQDEEEQQFLKVKAMKAMAADKSPKASYTDYFSDADSQKIAKLQKRASMTRSRIDVFDKSTGDAVVALNKSAVAPKVVGEDWLDLRIVPVAISLPQDKAVRRVLDKYKSIKWDERDLY